MTRLQTALLATLAALAVAAHAATDAGVSPNDTRIAPGAWSRVVFDYDSPLASVDEILRRTSGPLAYQRVLDYLREQAKSLPDHGVTLSEEHFRLYVPIGEEPRDGYGLLVFISPDDTGEVPSEWGPLLDKYHLIFVAADKSGNEENLLFRRVPLALDAYANVAARFRLDPQRVYVSGFSGGSRSALRLALSYPDIFHGAILNSGSDAFGVPEIPVPSADLFRTFQERSRVVLVSGSEDSKEILSRDEAMLASAKRLCVRGVEQQPMWHVGHSLMREAVLDHALSWIGNADDDKARDKASDDALARCRAGIDADIAQRLDEFRALIAQGKPQDARRELLKLDERYGGLAAPASVELARQLPPK